MKINEAPPTTARIAAVKRRQNPPVVMGRRTGLAASFCAMLMALIVIGSKPVYSYLRNSLITRFPVPALDNRNITGIVVLGGASDPASPASYADGAATSEAGRILATAELARRFPGARVIYSGAEASIGARWLENRGVSKARIELETRSYNTAENARYSFEMARPQKDQTWLLVTSAYHMPRAVGSFRAVGFTVEPYPVHGAIRRSQLGMNALWRDQIVHEWLGLILYRLSGRTKAFFPAPEQNLDGVVKAARRESGV